jgi:hypothetical protein
MTFRGHGFLAVIFASTLLACTVSPIKMQIKRGNEVVKERDISNLDDTKAAAGDLGDVYAESFQQMVTQFSQAAVKLGELGNQLAHEIESILEVPPRGTVKLSDLSAGLASYEGKPAFDFLVASTQKKDAKYDFTYTRIGVTEFDDFFRAVAETYACAYEIGETRGRIANLQGRSSRTAVEQRYLEELEAFSKGVVELGVGFTGRIQELVARGERLVASAPSSVKHPKVALHIPLIIKGLRQSVRLLKDTTLNT